MSYIRVKNLVNQRFGRLTVLRDVGRTNVGRVIWLCQCDCGKEKAIVGHDLGKTLSCGCLYSETRGTTHSTHRMRRTPLYEVWSGMKARCSNKNHFSYKYYGGRGITVCQRWQSFVGFYEDMFSTYQKGLSLERIDNNGNYEFNNCKWTTRLEQSNNQRSNHLITYQGKTQTMIEWSRELGFKYDLIRQRLNQLNWSIEKAFNTT